MTDRLHITSYSLERRPSFFVRHKVLRREMRRHRAMGYPVPIWTINPKSAGARFAQSHGVGVPAILDRFDSAADPDWRRLPDEFVLKPENGSFSRGVFPLLRTDDGYVDLLDEAAGPQVPDAYTQALLRHEKAPKNRGGLLVEELLLSPHHERPTLAPDVKLYCFYGTAGLIMVRTTNGSRDNHGFRYRYFDADGADLGDIRPDDRIDPAIPAPLHVPELVRCATTLSKALRVPFARIDFYEQADRVVFGEVTPCPGGRQEFRPDVDEALGQLWEDAVVNLNRDLNMATGALNPQFGPYSHDHEDFGAA